jgi:hypothetical protein
MTMVMGQTDSLVSALKQDQRYVGLCAAETLGYFSLAHRSSKASDLGDFFGGQELLESCDASNVDGMLFIAGIVSPFEIGSDTISFHSVNVVDHGQIFGIWNEGESHQSVNVNRLAQPTSIKINVGISKFVDAGFKNLPVYSSGFEPIADTVQTSNAAEIANFVEISEVGDCDRSPFFNDSDIHVTGYPSGYDGLMIKDPSHAPTSDGSAIMASTSITYNRRLRFR